MDVRVVLRLPEDDKENTRLGLSNSLRSRVSTCQAGNSLLLIAQRVYRIQKRCLISRKETKKQPYQPRKAERQQNIQQRNYRCKRRKHFNCRNADKSEYNPDNAANQRQYHRLGQKLPANIPGLGADSHSDTDFARSFRY